MNTCVDNLSVKSVANKLCATKFPRISMSVRSAGEKNDCREQQWFFKKLFMRYMASWQHGVANWDQYERFVFVWCSTAHQHKKAISVVKTWHCYTIGVSKVRIVKVNWNKDKKRLIAIFVSK